MPSTRPAGEFGLIVRASFVPEDSIVNAPQPAGLRGGDVRILKPENPDQVRGYLARYFFFEEAGSTGEK